MLSSRARALWGKLGARGENQWLPLWLHLADTGAVARLLWESWLPTHTREAIASGMSDTLSQPMADRLLYAEKAAIFLAAIHDVGKATPCFAGKASKVGFGEIVDEITSCGLPIVGVNSTLAREFPHALAGERILELQGLPRSYAVIVGGHHGKPPDNANNIERVESYPKITGVGQADWEAVHQELVAFALAESGLGRLPRGTLSIPAQVLLSGFLIMADWLASGVEYFPLLSRDFPARMPSARQRAENAWKTLNLPAFGEFSAGCPWEELYTVRFGRTARPMQLAALRAACEAKQPGIFVIEAPMGEGKTEAALAVAEALARCYKMSGVYFALPTQATSDGIFSRLVDWIRALHPQESRSIFLAHGKAGFNEDYAGIKMSSVIYDDETGDLPKRSSVVVNDWLCGRKKGLLADFVAGTIDQVLFGGLKAKHLALRHLGLANKVVILDECHAYDTYMSSYLDLVLNWLGAYHVPVVVLSATLPPNRRAKLLQAYRESWGSKKKKSYISRKKATQPPENQPVAVVETLAMPAAAKDSYPLISYTEGTEIKEVMPPSSGRRLDVRIETLEENCLVEKLTELLSEGGCAGILRNTVKQAQETAQILEKQFPGRVRLLHSRFLACDRVRKEKELRELLGPGETQRPEKLIVVGTQVMEQSLDVDFDVMFTDICPMDLLLQRLGRLHRHDRKKLRPDKLRQAVCFIMGIAGTVEFSPGSTKVYGAYPLLKTKAFLEPVIRMPEDIPRLVRQAYEEGYEQEMEKRLSAAGDGIAIHQVCAAALAEYTQRLTAKKEKAKTFQIKQPQNQMDSLVNWLEVSIQEDASGKRGEATVRDSLDSLEVLAVREKADGALYTLPWLEKYPDVRIDTVADEGLAKAIAGCRVSLPACFTAKWNIDDVIEELEEIVLKYHLDGWYTSHWLEGELFLVLDEEGEMKLLDKIVTYDEQYGLLIQEQEG